MFGKLTSNKGGFIHENDKRYLWKNGKTSISSKYICKKFCNGFFIWRRYLHHWTRYFRRIPYVKNARAAVSITLIGLAAILTAFKVYDNIAKIAGAGTLVPITGFSNSIASPAMEFKSEGYVLGLSAKMFIIAGPVLVYGIISSIIYGIVLYIISLF